MEKDLIEKVYLQIDGVIIAEVSNVKNVIINRTDHDIETLDNSKEFKPTKIKSIILDVITE